MLSLAAPTSGSVRDGGTTSGCAGIYCRTGPAVPSPRGEAPVRGPGGRPRDGVAKGDLAGDLDADADGDRDALGDGLVVRVGVGVVLGVLVGVCVGVCVGVLVGSGEALEVGTGVAVSLGEGSGVNVGTGAWSRCRAARLAGGGKSSTGLLSSVSRTASVQVRVG